MISMSWSWKKDKNLDFLTEFGATCMTSWNFIRHSIHWAMQRLVESRFFLFDPHLWHADYQSSYSTTGKTVNTWNISRMFIVLRPITAKIRSCKHAINHQLINVLACGLVFSNLICFFSCNTTFQKYFWCWRFFWFDWKCSLTEVPLCFNSSTVNHCIADWWQFFIYLFSQCIEVNHASPNTAQCQSFWDRGCRQCYMAGMGTWWRIHSTNCTQKCAD